MTDVRPENPSIEEIRQEIESLSHLEMCRLWRFAPGGHKYFDSTGPYWPVFQERYAKLGGMTPIMSKGLGWEE